MPITIGSNVASLGAQRSLAQNSDALGRTFERLSSGLRINRASDDAAGLAISDRLGADARLYSGAARNISDGFSMIGIANGVLEQQSGILNRLAELAEQSANGSYSDVQRSTLDAEYRQLLKEFGRLGDSTTFNGLALLRGFRSDGLRSLDIQAGISGTSSARITSTSADTATLSGIINRDTLATADWNGVGGVAIDDLFLYLDFGAFGTPTTAELQSAFRDQVYLTEFTNAAGQTYEVALGVTSGSYFGPTSEQVGIHTFYRLKGSSGTWTASSGANITAYQGGTFNVDPNTGRVIGSSTHSADIAGEVMSLDFSGIQFLEQGSGSGNGSAIDFSGVDTVTRARSALGVIRSRLDELSQLRGNYGAFESRLQSALLLVLGNREAATQARSRIVDADIAAESANLALKSILQQSGAAVLAQANTQPQLALLLLRN